jgi:hypothetical protein
VDPRRPAGSTLSRAVTCLDEHGSRVRRRTGHGRRVAGGTVEGHLTQVFRKLDLSARDELAEALAPASG